MIRVWLGVSLVLLSAVTASAQSAPARVPVPDISGIWNTIDTATGGRYDAFEVSFPKPRLRPEFVGKPRRIRLEDPEPGQAPPAYDIRGEAQAAPRCAVGGGPGTGAGRGLAINSGGMSLMAAPDLVLIMRDNRPGGRHIYTDGRAFPANVSELPDLYSIGRWEGDTLVVTTRGFRPANTPWGEGWVEPTTVLTERYTLQPGGNRLVVTNTFDDPAVYFEPYTYQTVYERLPPDLYIFENWCDSRLWIEANQGRP
jgi:hypothetical protein